MLTELRTKSQITIPKDIVARLGLHEGDKLEIVEKDGTIQIMPVAVYPKKYLTSCAARSMKQRRRSQPVNSRSLIPLTSCLRCWME